MCSVARFHISGHYDDVSQIQLYAVFETYPVAVDTTACKSLVQYSMTMAKMNDVTKPIEIVLISAHGTTTAAFLHSSARCMAPSIPAYM
jgi:hypothetical protein